ARSTVMPLRALTRPPLPPLPVLFALAPDPAQLYTLSLHDALPISTREWNTPVMVLITARLRSRSPGAIAGAEGAKSPGRRAGRPDRKSTRLNSSHVSISYAVFCLNKKTDFWNNARSLRVIVCRFR